MAVSKRKAFGRSDDYKMLEMIESNPVLYDWAHDLSKDTAHRDRIWKQIAADLNKPGKNTIHITNLTVLNDKLSFYQHFWRSGVCGRGLRLSFNAHYCIKADVLFGRTSIIQTLRFCNTHFSRAYHS